jgi:hypothetical protein
LSPPDVDRAEGDLAVAHLADRADVVLELLLLAGEPATVQEHELGAVQADAAHVVERLGRQRLEVLDVEQHLDRDAVGGGRQAARLGQHLRRKRRKSLLRRCGLGQLLAAGVEDDRALPAVHDPGAAACGQRRDVDVRDGRDAERARQDRGVAGQAAAAGHDRGEPAAVEVGGVARQQLARDEDDLLVAVARRQPDGRAPGEHAQDLPPDVAQVGGRIAVGAGAHGRQARRPVGDLVAHRDLGVDEVLLMRWRRPLRKEGSSRSRPCTEKMPCVAAADLLLDARLDRRELLARLLHRGREPALLGRHVARGDRPHGHVDLVLGVEDRRAHRQARRHRQAAHDQRAARRLAHRRAASRWGLTARASRGELARDERRQVVGRDAPLLHAVALAQRHGAVGLGLAVDRHAPGRADLVLPAVAAADRARLVVEGRDALRAQLPSISVASSGMPSFLTSGNTPTLIGARRGCRCSTVRTSSSPGLPPPSPAALAGRRARRRARDLLLLVGLAEEGEQCASTPAAGSITQGVKRSRVWPSKYSSCLPELSLWR